MSEALKAVDAGSVTELEADLIRAMAARSSKETHEAVDLSKMFFGNTKELNVAYAEAMKEVSEKHKENHDVLYFYVEALMNLNPWQLWVKDSSGDIKAANETTTTIAHLLEEALAKTPMHAGLCHLYIHTMELSPTPEKALPQADVLRTAMPGYGHLVHVASHIDAWVGQYKEGLEANIKGVEADDAYVEATGIDSSFYKFYRLHNVHFVVWMAMFDGQSRIAFEYAEKITRMLPAGDNGVEFMLAKVVPMGAVYFEAFASVKWHVMIRFGKWLDLLQMPVPKKDGIFASTLATARYARAIAFAATNRIKEAEAEERRFHEALADPKLQGRCLHNNLMWKDDGSPSILGVAEYMLKGEIAYRKGHYDDAFCCLKEATKRDDGLAYDEPWGWMLPSRHALGALLLEQNKPQEAAEVYRQDLTVNKNNMWALFGLTKCLKAGAPPLPGETLAALHAKFKDASKRADIKFDHTCFCAGLKQA